MINEPESDDLFLAELYAEILSWPLPQENKTVDSDTLGRDTESTAGVNDSNEPFNKNIVPHILPETKCSGGEGDVSA